MREMPSISIAVFCLSLTESKVNKVSMPFGFFSSAASSSSAAAGSRCCTRPGLAQVRPRAAAPSTHTQIERALHEQGAGRPCVL